MRQINRFKYLAISYMAKQGGQLEKISLGYVKFFYQNKTNKAAKAPE